MAMICVVNGCQRAVEKMSEVAEKSCISQENTQKRTESEG